MNEIVTRLEQLEKDRNILSTAVAELQRVTSEFIRLQTQKIKELETRVSNLEAVAHTPGLFPDAWDKKAMKRIKELEAKVESLTRALDLWQELTGIEIVASPIVKTHMGQCEKCDRVGPLNDANICEGCFYEEIGV